MSAASGAARVQGTQERLLRQPQMPTSVPCSELIQRTLAALRSGINRDVTVAQRHSAQQTVFYLQRNERIKVQCQMNKEKKGNKLHCVLATVNTSSSQQEVSKVTAFCQMTSSW